MFSNFRRAREAPKELNVLPVMNLMVTLIPFLLLGAAFYKVSVIPTTLPTHDQSADETAPPPSDAIITLNLVIESDGIRLSATSATVAPEPLDALATTLPIAGGVDTERLTAAVARFKTAYPKSDTVLVLPAPQIPYQMLVNILDATRERASKGPNGERLTQSLFPVTVFSQRIDAEPDAGVPEEDRAGERPGRGGDE